MNGYVAFYKDSRLELQAESLYEAKQKAITYFKPTKSKEWAVFVILAELGGKEVTHTADF